MGCANVLVSDSEAESIHTGLFKDPKQRDHVLKYQPLGLAIDRRGLLRLAEVFRDEAAWQEHPVAVTECQWGFFASHQQKQIRLERATRVAPLDYQWRLGRTVLPVA